MAAQVFENTPSGRVSALAAAAGDESRLWFDNNVIRVMDVVPPETSGVAFNQQIAEMVPFSVVGTGAVARLALEKLRDDKAGALDFGAVSDLVTLNPSKNLTALNAGLAYSAATGRPLYIDIPVTVSGTVVIPNGASLVCIGKGVIKPSSDFPVLVIPTAEAEHCINVSVAGIGNYSSIAVEITGEALAYARLRIPQITIRGPGTSAPGTGLALRSNGGFVAGVHLGVVTISGFNTLLKLHANTPTPIAGNKGYVNGNVFDSVRLTTGVYFIDLEQNEGNYEVSGNKLNNVLIQPTSAAKRAIRLVGADVMDNSFDGKIWDWGVAAAGDDGRVLAIQGAVNDSGSNYDVANNYFVFPGLYPWYADIHDKDYGVFAGAQVSSADKNTALVPRSAASLTFTDADDVLAYAHRYYSVTYSGPATSSEALGPLEAFKPGSDTYAQWSDAIASEASYTIDFGSVRAGFGLLGMQFAVNMPQSVTIEASDTGSTYTPLLSLTGNKHRVITWAARDGITVSARYIRFRFSNINKSGPFALTRIFGAAHGAGSARRRGAVVPVDGQGGRIQRLLPATGTSATWFKLFRIQSENPVTANAFSSAVGQVFCQPQNGSGYKQAIIANFGFSVRNGGSNAAAITPLCNIMGDGAVEFRVYKTADGWHDLYIKIPDNTQPASVDYYLMSAAEGPGAFTASDPTADGTLVLVWSSATGVGQGSYFSGPVRTGVTGKASLPAASACNNALMSVSDPAAGKGRLVYSDGVAWRYVSDDSSV